MKIQDFTVEGRMKGDWTGPWESLGPVTVRGEGMVMTCKHLKIWPPVKGKAFERLEASGDIQIEGQRRDSNENLWEIEGSADSLTYDRKSATLVLEGGVRLSAVNRTAEAEDERVLEAEKLTLNLEKKTFELGGDGKRPHAAATLRQPDQMAEEGDKS
jgi:lipopolysaccharide export system protein LptA